MASKRYIVRFTETNFYDVEVAVADTGDEDENAEIARAVAEKELSRTAHRSPYYVTGTLELYEGLQDWIEEINA